jgi:hypothetical protein
MKTKMSGSSETIPSKWQYVKLTPEQETKFWSLVDKNGDCWEWLGRKRSGYGRFYVRKGAYNANRLVWMIKNGVIPESHFICHHCDNPGCVNPSHLFLGTCLDNIRDMIKKGRKVTIRGDAHYARTNPEKLARGDRSGPRLHPECVARGERNGDSRLFEWQVREIRQKYAIGGWTWKTLGREYGVSKTAIGFILKRKLWKNVA